MLPLKMTFLHFRIQEVAGVLWYGATTGQLAGTSVIDIVGSLRPGRRRSHGSVSVKGKILISPNRLYRTWDTPSLDNGYSS